MAVHEGEDRYLDGEAGRVSEEDALFGGGAAWGGEFSVGLEGAEVDVDWLPDEEENVADESGDEAVEEV